MQPPSRKMVWGTDLDPFLLALHQSTDVAAFWSSLQNLLNAAFPNQSIIAALRVVGDDPPVFFHTHRLPHHTPRWFADCLAAHPCYAHLCANPGLPVLILSEVLTPEIILGHPFYREYMKPEGWFHGMAFIFWTGDHMDSLIPVNRSRAQPPFSDEEFQLALWLHPWIEAALRRVMAMLPISEAHQSVVSYLADLPVPALRLSWDLKLVFANRAARRLVEEWNHGSDDARRTKRASRIRIPADIRAACKTIRKNILDSADASWPPPVLPGPVRLVCPQNHGLSAVIRPSLWKNNPLGDPGFWVQFETHADNDGAPCNLVTLSMLSPAERMVAEMVRRGLSNAEIAKCLHRSLSTVKAQLQSAFRKLEVRNRAGLIAKLHSGSSHSP